MMLGLFPAELVQHVPYGFVYHLLKTRELYLHTIVHHKLPLYCMSFLSLEAHNSMGTQVYQWLPEEWRKEGLPSDCRLVRTLAESYCDREYLRRFISDTTIILSTKEGL